jgi:hypothetical protein
MKPADPLGGQLPPAPPGRDLPHHDRHRRELLAVVRSGHTGERRWPAAPRLAPLGAALAVLVLVAGVFVLSGLLGGSRSSGQPGTGPASPGQPAARGARPGPLVHRTESSVVSSAVTGLVLRGSVGAVNITGAERSTVAITAQLGYRGSAPVITRQVTHGLLNLGYRCPSGSRDCGVSFDLTVPRALAVTVRWGTGDIRLDGLTFPVLVRTGVGQIQASGMSGGLIRLYTGTGMISVGCTASPRLLVASSGVGTVTIHVPVTVPYRVSAKTQVGSARVTVPQAARSEHKISVFTGAGTIAVTGN